jgi:chromosome segregation ATPase
MTNVTPFNKAPRLSEQEVHQAAQNLLDAGEALSSLTLLRELGRGSLTTITKYLGTFNKGDNEGDVFDAGFISEVPEALFRSTKLLAIKIWTESQNIANKELESQREVLQQAVKLSTDRVKEAELFSDEQSKRLEDIERSYEEKATDLTQTLTALNIELKENREKLNQSVISLEISKTENNALRLASSEIKERLNEIKSSREIDMSELKNDNNSKIEALKSHVKDQEAAFQRLKDNTDEIQHKLESENKRLDLQVAKQTINLDLLTSRLEEEKMLRASDVKENKALREKAALLEGELTTWKSINWVQNKETKPS